MDLKAFPSDNTLRHIDAISVSFFGQHYLQTRDKLNQTELRRFFDNLSYHLSICSKDFSLIKDGSETVDHGHFGEVMNKLCEEMATSKPHDGHTLRIDFSKQSDIQEALQRLCRQFEIDGLNYDYIGKKVRIFLDQVLTLFFKTYTDNSGCPSSSITEYLDGQLKAIQKLCAHKSIRQFSIDDHSLETMAALNTKPTINDFKKTTIDENIDGELESRFGKIRSELNLLESAFKDLSKHNHSEMIELKLSNIEKLMSEIPAALSHPIPSLSSPKHAEASPKEKTQMDLKKSSHETHETKKLSFLPFFRVKEVSSTSDSPNLDITPLNLNLVSNTDKHHDMSKVNSISYHICDLQDQTLSLSESFSPEESVIKPTDNWFDKLTNRNTQIDMTKRSSVKLKFKNSKSFANTINEVDDDPEAYHNFEKIPDPHEQAFLPTKLLVSFLEPFDPNIEAILGDDTYDVSKALKLFFDHLYQKIHKLETENDRLRDTASGTHAFKHENSPSEAFHPNPSKLREEPENEQELLRRHRAYDKGDKDAMEHYQLQVESLSNHLKASQSRLAALESLITQQLVKKIKSLKQSITSLCSGYSENPLITEIREIGSRVKLMGHSKLQGQDGSSNSGLSPMPNQVKSQLQAMTTYKTKFQRIEKKLQSIFERISLADGELCEQVAFLKGRFVNIEVKFERQIKPIQKSFVEAKKSNELIVSDKNHLSFMNSNLIKELAVLSDAVMKLTDDKEKLEDQLAKQAEWEEEIRHLKLKIEMLKEKLELSSSLKEMSDKHSDNPVEDGTCSNQGKGFLSAPFDSIQPKYLKTIDENDELNDGTELQEGHSQLKDNLSINTRDLNLPAENFVLGSQRASLQISLPHNYLYIQSTNALESNFVIPILLDKQSNPENTLASVTHLTQSKNLHQSSQLLIDHRIFEKCIHFENEVLTENSSLHEIKTVPETKVCGGNNAPLLPSEFRTSQKKSLFNMQEVHKSLDNTLKPSLFSNATSKELLESKFANDIKDAEYKERRKQSDFNETHDNFQASNNSTEFYDLYDLKHLSKNKLLFTSLGSNKAMRLSHPSQHYPTAKTEYALSKIIVSKQLERINQALLTITTIENSLSDRLIRLKQKLKTSIKNPTGECKRKVNRLTINDANLNHPENDNPRDLEDADNENLFLSIDPAGAIIIDNKSKGTIKVQIFKNHAVSDGDDSSHSVKGNKAHELQRSLDELATENEELRKHMIIVNEQLESTIGLSSEYEAILDFTYKYLSELLPSQASKASNDNQLNIQELLEAVSQEFMSMQRSLVELSEIVQKGKIEVSPSQSNMNMRTPSKAHRYISEHNDQERNSDFLERKSLSLEKSRSRPNLSISDNDKSIKSLKGNSDEKKYDAHEYGLRFRDVVGQAETFETIKEVQNENSNFDDGLINSANRTDYNSFDFKRKQEVLKEGFNDLLSNILYIIQDNFELITETGTMLDESNTIMKAHSPSKAPNSESIKQDLMSLVEKIYENNTHLKEMTDFLNSNLMKFISEIDTFKDQAASSLPEAEQLKDLIQENDFLYHKLNASNKQIEYLMYHIQRYEDQNPEIAKVISNSHKRTRSVPNISIVAESDKELDKSGADLHEKIKTFLNKLFNTNIELPLLLPREEQRRMCIDSNRNMTNLGQEKEFIASEEEADADQRTENKVEILENYNMFLLNILKQVKVLIDDNGTPIKIRMNQLLEISRDLDAMYANKGHSERDFERRGRSTEERRVLRQAPHPARPLQN